MKDHAQEIADFNRYLEAELLCFQHQLTRQRLKILDGIFFSGVVAVFLFIFIVIISF